MRGLVWSLTAATALALVASPLSAQDASDTEAPAATIQPLALEFSAEGLSGPGAAALRSDIEGAQFIAIGEDHGFADPPALLAAFAAEGKSHGFDTYAIEVGPWSTAWIRERLTTGGVDGLAKDLEGRPLSLPFLSLREEAEAAMGFLEDGRLWGVDQEFIGPVELRRVTVGAGQHLPYHRVLGDNHVADTVGFGQHTPVEQDRCIVAKRLLDGIVEQVGPGT